jgi:hypothetical protein
MPAASPLIPAPIMMVSYLDMVGWVGESPVRALALLFNDLFYVTLLLRHLERRRQS